MTAWQYKVVSVQTHDESSFWTNELGRKGWELVCVAVSSTIPYTTKAYFKRQIEAMKDAQTTGRGPSDSFLAAMERHRRDSVCRAAAKLAMDHIRENIQVVTTDEAWAKHEYILMHHLISQMGHWPQPKDAT